MLSSTACQAQAKLDGLFFEIDSIYRNTLFVNTSQMHLECFASEFFIYSVCMSIGEVLKTNNIKHIVLVELQRSDNNKEK